MKYNKFSNLEAGFVQNQRTTHSKQQQQQTVDPIWKLGSVSPVSRLQQSNSSQYLDLDTHPAAYRLHSH
jgi:hypothetical protein